jgi:hypothetical protein
MIRGEVPIIIIIVIAVEKESNSRAGEKTARVNRRAVGALSGQGELQPALQAEPGIWMTRR